MKLMGRLTHVNSADLPYRDLYRTGAAAALIAAAIFRRNLDAEFMLLRAFGVISAGPAAAPSTVTEWFTLLQNSKLLGLTLLNLFDLINYGLVGLLFLALFAALRRVSPSWIVIAAALGFTGIAVYFASNQAFSLLALSNQYAASTTAVQREMLLAAGQALLAIHQSAALGGPGICLSFLMVTTAGLILSAAMLRDGIFGRGTAYMGILANGFGLGYYLVYIFAPQLVFIPLSISAIFLLIWYVRTGRRLWVLSAHGMVGSRQTIASSDGDAPQRTNCISPSS